MPHFPPRWTIGQCLALLSVAWVAGMLPATTFQGHIASFWITLGLIGCNFAFSLGTLFIKKRLEIALNVVQVALFCLLFFLVFKIFGSQHYRYQHEPGAIDWLQFTGVHLLRAFDVVDCLDEFGIDMQSIKHASPLTGGLLVALHLVVDVFLLTYLASRLFWCWQIFIRHVANPAPEKSEVFEEHAAAEKLGDRLRLLRDSALGICIFCFLLHASKQRWAPSDWLYWPLDNLLRIIDFPDAMHIFGWRLHNVQKDAWTMSLAVALRFIVGLYVAVWLNHVSLRMLGHRALKTMDDFVGDLKDPSPSIRQRATLALKKIGPAARTAAAALVPLIADSSNAVAKTALEALDTVDPEWAQSPGAHEAIPVLIQKLVDIEPDARATAALTLERIDPNWYKNARSFTSFLIVKLTDPNVGVREAAAQTLDKIDPEWSKREFDQAVVSQLLSRMVDSNPTTRRTAVEWIDQLCPGWSRSEAACASIAGLLEKIEAGDHGQRAAAADILGKMEDAATLVIPSLTENLQHWNSDIGAASARALGRLGPRARGVVSALIRQTVHPESILREEAFHALAQIDPAWHHSDVARGFIPEWIQKLRDPNPELRYMSARTLGKIGSAARAAIPILISQSISEPHPGPRIAAAQALDQIDPAWVKSAQASLAVRDLMDAIRHGDDEKRVEIAIILGQIGPPAAQAIPELILQLFSKNPVLHQTSRSALSAIDPSWPANPFAREIIPVLIEKLDDWFESERLIASAVLQKISPELHREAMAARTERG